MLTPFSFLLRRAQRISINFIIFSLIMISLLNLSANAQTAHAVGISNAGGGFNGAWGVAVDSIGNVYVADTWNNAVKQIPPGCADPSCVKTLGSGFSSPDGVAVDSAGNVFVADFGSNSVKEIVAAGGYQTVNTLASGFNMPWSVAVDSIGNVYVADTGNYVVKEIVAAGGYQTVKTLLSGLSLPCGVAVDRVGNVYVADWQTVKEFVAVDGYTTMNTLGSGFSYPAGVAVDGAGNVYVADDGNNAVKEIVAASGYATVTTLLHSSSMNPHAVAVDSGGNVYVADPWNSVVTEISTSGAVKAPTTAVGSTSSAVTIAFTFDTGGQIGAPMVLTQGATNLDFADAGTGTCTTNGTSYTYNAGDQCTVDVTFTPKYPGQRMGGAVLLDANGNVIATAYLVGNGSGPQVAFYPGTQSTIVNSGLSYPYGAAVDGNGNVYIADNNNNRVVKVPWTGSGYGTQSTVTTDVSYPFGVAVDGSGNVYVADRGNNRVVKVPWTGSDYGTQSTVATNLNQPTSVVVDASGNLYVADSDNRVVKVPWTGSGYGTQSTVTTDVSSPFGVAVDGSGNVYVADEDNNRVVKVPWTGSDYGTQSTIINTLYPIGVAVDGTGNVYFDNGGEVVKVPWTGSSYGTQRMIAGGTQAYGVAVDGSGNLYFPDGDRMVKVDVADAPSLNFPKTSVGAVSPAQDVVVENIGNTPLHISQISTAANFTSQGTDTTCASSDQSLDPASNCILGIEFAPTLSGNISGSVVLTDDSLNQASAVQTISLSGEAIPADTSIEVNSSVSPQTFGGEVTFTAAITPSAATGTVTFYDGGTQLGQPQTVNGGQATLTISSLTAGSHTISAVYSGDVNYNGSNSTTTETITKATPVITWTTPADIIYGTVLSGTQLNASTAVDGTWSYSPASGTLLSAGIHTLNVTFTPNDNSNHTTSTASVNLGVNPASASVTPTNVSKMYGTADPALSGTLSGFLASDNVTARYNRTAGETVAGGPYTISATLSPSGVLGNYNITYNTAQFTITKATTSATLQTSAPAVMLLSNLVLTAKVTSAAGAPTGTVNFMDGSTSLGNGVLDPTGTATLNVSTLSAGSHSITAIYNGDSNFSGFTSAAVDETVQDFKLVAAGGVGTIPQATVLPGGVATFQLQVIPTNGATFVGAIDLRLSGAPAGATYTITPSTISVGSALQTLTIQVQTPKAVAGLRTRGREMPLIALGLLLPLFGMVHLRKSGAVTMKRVALVCLLLAIATLGMSACGGGSGFFNHGSQAYNLQLSATSGALQHSATLNLNIQ